MADNLTSKVLLDVEVSTQEPVKNIAELRDAVDKLKKQQKELKKAGQENSEEYVVLEQKIKALNGAIGENTRTIQANIKEAANAEGSYNALSAQLTKLKQAYHAAGSDQEREAILKDLRSVSDQLKALDQAQGVYVRNVGNYKSAISELVPGFQQLNVVLAQVGLDITDISASISKGFASVGSSLSNLVKAISSGSGIKAAFADAGKAVVSFGKTLLASPIGWIAAAVGALVAIFMKLKDAIAKNDEAGTNLARLFDSFQPIINLVTSAFAKLADIIGKVAGAMADFIAWMSGSVEQAQALTTAVDNLEEAERQYAVNSAKRNRDVAELMDKAMDKEQYSAEQRKAYLEEASKLQAQNLEDEKAIAAEHLRILEETAKRDKDTSDATMDAIAQARAAMYKAEENYFNGMKNINKRIQSLNAEIKKDEEEQVKAAQEAAKKRAEAARKLAEERKKAAEEAAKIELDIRRKTEDFTLLLIEDETEREVATRKLAGERELEDLRERLAKEKNLTAKAREQLENLIKAKEQQLQVDLQKIRDKAKEDKDKKDKDDAEKEAKKQADAAKRVANLRAELAKDGSAEELAARKEVLNLQMEAELANVEATEEEKKLIRQKYAEQQAELDAKYQQQQLQRQLDKTNAAIEYAQQATEIVTTIFDTIAQNENADLERYKEQNDTKKDVLKSRLESGIISQEQYEKQVEALNEEQAAKEKELQLKQAKRTKAMAIMNATLNAAAAIISSLAQSPIAIGPVPNPAGIASLALATTMGAMQIAAAAATPLPKASRGALLHGKSHAQGGIPIEAEGGEAIINKRATTRFLPLLSAINQSTGGVALYGQGGMIGSSKIEQAANLVDYDRLAQACSAMNVQVAVTDINNGQGKYAQVEQLRTF